MRRIGLTAAFLFALAPAAAKDVKAAGDILTEVALAGGASALCPRFAISAPQRQSEFVRALHDLDDDAEAFRALADATVANLPAVSAKSYDKLGPALYCDTMWRAFGDGGDRIPGLLTLR